MLKNTTKFIKITRHHLARFMITCALFMSAATICSAETLSTHTIEEPCSFVENNIDCSEQFMSMVEVILTNEQIEGSSTSPFQTFVGNDADHGISYGFAQFNEKSGMLGKVVRHARSQYSRNSKVYKNLTFVLNRLNVPRNRRDLRMIKSILGSVGDSKMVIAQMKVFVSEYYVPTYYAAVGMGIYGEEALAQLIDHRINTGNGGMDWVINRVGVNATIEDIRYTRRRAYRSFKMFKRYGKTWLQRISKIQHKFITKETHE